jgi:hypothetical protein
VHFPNSLRDEKKEGHKQFPYFHMRRSFKNFFAKLCGGGPRTGQNPAAGAADENSEGREERAVQVLAEVVKQAPLLDVEVLQTPVLVGLAVEELAEVEEQATLLGVEVLQTSQNSNAQSATEDLLWRRIQELEEENIQLKKENNSLKASNYETQTQWNLSYQRASYFESLVNDALIKQNSEISVENIHGNAIRFRLLEEVKFLQEWNAYNLESLKQLQLKYDECDRV